MFSAMHTTRMLVVLIRTVIIYLALLLGIRLMGKRTIGELQPFEFVITMAIADLACMPMQDIDEELTQKMNIVRVKTVADAIRAVL